MSVSLKRAKNVWKEKGFVELLRRSMQFGFNTYIRPLLPKRVVTYNGVSVRGSRLGDSIIPWQTQSIPGYEETLIKGIREYVKTGDSVVIVGGGWGVSTVVAAKQVGKSGQVTTFEAGTETVRKVKDTVQLNGVDDQVSIQNVVVGQAVSIRGDCKDARILSPTDLPNCDVLVLDCEGAEIEILEEMEIRPRNIIVESHGLFDATETMVRNKLDNAGYVTTESKVAEERLREVCEDNGIYVLFSEYQREISNK